MARGAVLAAAALLAGSATPPPPAARLEATTSRPAHSTFARGEPVWIALSASGLAPGTRARLEIAVRDHEGGTVAALAPVLAVDGSGRAAFRFAAPARRLGWYEVRAALPGGATLASQGTRPAGIVTYAVVPDPAKRADHGAATRFGLQGGFSVAAPVQPLLGTRYILPGYNWAQLEPRAPGQFPAERAAARARGQRHPRPAPEFEGATWNGTPWHVHAVASLTGASLPRWALREGTQGTICKSFGALSPAGEHALPAFAEAQARAFAADYAHQPARFYQVTWEPAVPWCYGGTPGQLVALYAAAAPAIRKGDPSAIVAGPTLFIGESSSVQLDALWAAGLGRHVDALSIHPYADWPPERHGMPAILRQQLAAARRAIGRPVPFIGTEHGYQSHKIGNREKAMGDVRAALIMLGEGAALDFGFYVADFWSGGDIARAETYGFYWNLDPATPFGSARISPKIVVPAYAAMTFLIDGATSEGPLPGLAGTQMGYRFRRGGRRIDVVWDHGGTSAWPVPPGARVCDWMGNCARAAARTLRLGGTPVYLVQ